VVLRADDGRLSLIGALSSGDLPRGFTNPVVALPDEVTKIYDTAGAILPEPSRRSLTSRSTLRSRGRCTG
jgi:hypothetical protein